MRIVKDAGVAALGFNHLEEDGQGRSIFERGFGQLAADLFALCRAAQVDHPTGEDERELAQIFASGGTLAAHQFNGLNQLNPVAGGLAQRLVHVGEQGDGAGSRAFGGGDHQGREILRVFALAQKRAGTGFHVEHQCVEARGKFFGEDGRADEAGVFDRCGAVAQRIEHAVGGNERGGLADDGSAAIHENCLKFGQCERRAVAGNRFKFVEGPAGVSECPAADHGDGHSAGRGDGRDQEAGLVADPAGGVLVHGYFAKALGREFFSRVAHRDGERAGFIERQAANPGSHEPGRELLQRNGCVGGAGDKEADLAGVERAAVALFANEVDGVQGSGHGGGGLDFGTDEIIASAADQTD